MSRIMDVEPLACIDFGNSFTKVAVRPNQDEESLVLKHPDLQDEFNLCIPTPVARRRGADQWFCGSQVARLGERARETELFRNWKPALLDEDAADNRAVIEAPLDDASWEAVKRALGVTDAQRRSIESLRHVDSNTSARVVAVKYFTWLYRFVADFCDQQGWKIPAEGLEARITLPAFDGAAHGEATLVAALQESGWRIARSGRSLPEPVANTLGVLTAGRNAVIQRPGAPKQPWWIKMFSKRDPLIHSKRDGMHWLLVVDLGSFTLDFALMGFEQRNLTQPTALAESGDSTLWRRSVPLGVTDLDRSVAAALAGDARAQFLAVANGPGWELEVVHRSVYGSADRTPVPIGGHVSLLADAEGRRQINAVIARFAHEVGVHLHQFLTSRPSPRIDQIVLTGGGMNIPEVSAEVLERLGASAPRLVHAPIRGAHDRFVALDPPELVRSATALGGTSVYFDYRAPAPARA